MDVSILYYWDWDNLTEDEKTEIHAEAASAGHLQIPREVQWMNELESICQRFLYGRNVSSDTSLFWIRLHGFLTEISYQKPTTPINNSAQQFIADIVAEAAKRYNAIRCKLSDDEIIYIDYQRTIEAHLFPKTYFLHRRSVRKPPIRERNIPALNRKYSLTEIRRSIERVEQLGSRDVIAEAISQRISEDVAGFATYLRAPTHPIPFD